jgi:rhamnosyltransferase
VTRATILIRTKNEGTTLGRVLQAVRKQTEQDFEILVVDSGSSDNTVETAESYGARVVSITPESFTYGYALNVGMENSQSELVVSLSGHAVPCDEHWLSSLLAPFEDPRVAGVSSYQIPEDIWYTSMSRTLYQLLYWANVSRDGQLCLFLFHCASAAVRTSVWHQVHFDEALAACEDHDWARQVTRLGYKIAHSPKSRVVHSHALSVWPRAKKAYKETIAIWRMYSGL